MAQSSAEAYPEAYEEEEDNSVDPIAYLEVIDDQDGESCGEHRSSSWPSHHSEPSPPEISIYPGQEIQIGRDNKCRYMISDPRVSKKHFRIYSIIYEEGQTDFPPLVYCEDLESSNGTYVNNILIGIICRERTGFLLNDGDLIEIRPSWKFRFHQSIDQKFTRDVAEIGDLQLFEDRFRVSDRVLGKGTYGSVYLAKETATLKQVACKIINLKACGNKHMEGRSYVTTGNPWHDQLRRATEGRKFAMREIKILAELNHPHIINLHKAFCSSMTLYMILELAPGGDLFSYLESYGGHLDDWHARVISRQLALAIEYLHSKGIAHRDIKPENVLIAHTDFGGRIILTDFGFANFVNIKTGRLDSLVGTAGFVAPEVESDELRKHGYTLAADLWSLGVLTACILTGQSLIPRRELSQLSQIQIADRFLGIDDYYIRHQWLNMAPRAQRFLRQLLTVDPTKRMTATEALGHSWFKKPYSEGVLLEERYHKIIRFWKQREGDEGVIEYLQYSSQAELETPGAKFRRMLPDASSSPYFSLDRHLLQKTQANRKELLASLAQSGSAFVASMDSQKKPSASQIVRRHRSINILAVNGRDLFGKLQEIQPTPPADDDDEMALIPTEHLPENLSQMQSLNLSGKPSNQEPSGTEGEVDDVRGNKRARKESWDPEDHRIHETIAKELPLYTSAKVFREAVAKKKEVDREAVARPSYRII